MPGLVPAVHAFRQPMHDVDARDKPGHAEQLISSLSKGIYLWVSYALPAEGKTNALLDHRTPAVSHWPECLLGRNRRDQAIVVVRIFRLVRLFDLEQIHRMDHAAIGADRDVAEQPVL